MNSRNQLRPSGTWLVLALILLPLGGLARGENDSKSPKKPVKTFPNLVFETMSPGIVPAESIRVAFYNVENFSDGIKDGKKRTEDEAYQQAKSAAGILNQINADVLFLFEIENAAVVDLLRSFLSVEYRMSIISDWNSGHGHDRLNAAILSRFPLVDCREIDFGMMKTPRPPRGLLRAAIDLDPDTRLVCYGVHLKSNWGNADLNIDKRRGGLEWLVRDATAYRESRPNQKLEFLVVGDFNVDPASPGFSQDHSLEPLKGWVDFWKGRLLRERVTLPSRAGDPDRKFLPVTFDRAYGSPELAKDPWRAGSPQVVPLGVDTHDIFAAPGASMKHVSDHFPVYLDIQK